jgi:hypothetical protein
MINYKSNDDFKSYIIIGGTQDGYNKDLQRRNLKKKKKREREKYKL